MSYYFVPICLVVVGIFFAGMPNLMIDCNNDVGVNTTPQVYLQEHGFTIEEGKAKCNDTIAIWDKIMIGIVPPNFIVGLGYSTVIGFGKMKQKIRKMTRLQMVKILVMLEMNLRNEN